MTSALLLVDAQRNMLEGAGAVPGCDAVRAVLRGLLDGARGAGVPVVHIQNDGGPEDPDAPFTSGWELVFERAPGEEVVRKNVCDAFEADKGLAERLRAEGVETVIVAGMQSQFCVTDTSLGALRAGFSVVVPHEAHATYDEGSREAVAVAQDVEQSLYSAGVSVMPLSEVELVR